MAIITFISEEEAQKYTKVQEKDLNELLQEVRLFDDKLHIKECVYPEYRKFFRKISPYEVRYVLYSINGTEAQILNFPISKKDNEFNRSGYSYSQTITYLYGLINGQNKKPKIRCDRWCDDCKAFDRSMCEGK